MAELQPWQAVLDQTFLQRLLRPALQPGCIDRRISQRIIARYQQFAQQMPLLSHLLKRQNHTAGFQADAVPIVYAQPGLSQAGHAANVDHSIHNHSFQTVRPTDNPSTPVVSAPERPGQKNQPQSPTSAKPVVVQAKLADSPVLPQTSVPAIAAQPPATVSPITMQWFSSPASSPLSNQPNFAVFTNRLGSNSLQTPVIAAYPQRSSSPPEYPVQPQHPLLPVVQVRIASRPEIDPSIAADSGSGLTSAVADLPFVNSATPSRERAAPVQVEQSFTPLTAQATLPIIRPSRGHSGNGITQPFVFAVPAAGGAMAPGIPAPQQNGMEQFMPSPNGNHALGYAPSMQTGIAYPTNSSNPLPGMNGQAHHVSPIQPAAVTPEQVKRLIDVEALADKVERQLMRRLSIEHERRGWTQ